MSEMCGFLGLFVQVEILKTYDIFIKKIFPCILCDLYNLVIVITLELYQVFTAWNDHGVDLCTCIVIELQ